MSAIPNSLGLIPPARRVPIPGAPQDLAHVLDKGLAEKPDAEALVGRYARYSYRQLDAVVSAAAAALASLGIKSGDRVVCSSANDPDVIIAFLATQWLGGIWVGVNRALTAPEKKYMLENSGCAVFLGDKNTAPQVAEMAAQLPELRHVIEMEPGKADGQWAKLVAAHDGAKRPEVDIDSWAPAAIAYTSGTTGFPKGAVLSQHNMLLVGAEHRYRNPDDPATRWGSIFPFTILNMMILVALKAFQSAGTCICMDRVDAVGVAEWVKNERVNQFPMMVATVHDLLTNPEVKKEDIASLISPGVGGGGFPDTLRELFRERFGVEPQFTYGLTEAPTGVAYTNPRAPRVPGSSGLVIPSLRVRIADTADKDVPVGETGQILIGPADSGPFANVYAPMLGYWKNAEATAKALAGGWLHTGDMGYFDADGNLFVSGRGRDMIIRGGANIYPAEIERVLAGDSRLRETAVLGRPDTRLGETVVVFVEPMPGVAADEALLDELKARCNAELARYKIPNDWIFVTDMPRNTMRKVQKNKLAEMYFKPG